MLPAGGGTGIHDRDDRLSERLDRARPRGLVTVIAGCMFSGKTTALLARLECRAGAPCVAFKHATDSRYSSSHIVSHAGKAWPAVAVRDSQGIIDHLQGRTSSPGKGPALIVIDEGHFFDEGLVEAVRFAAGVCDVVVAALQPDSWSRPFPLVARLFEFADEPLLKYASCARCNARADLTQRLTPIAGGQMAVDPSHYEPRCRACWRPPPEG